MACFSAPSGAALITTTLGKKADKKYRLSWLNAMLWGGSAMLAVEHVISGEIVPYPPFLTAMSNPADTAVMVKEIINIGGAMTIAIFTVWAILVWLSWNLKWFKNIKYNLDFLLLMLFGGLTMIVVDQALAIEEAGGHTADISTSFAQNNVGLLMLLPVFLIWLFSLVKKPPVYFFNSSNKQSTINN